MDQPMLSLVIIQIVLGLATAIAKLTLQVLRILWMKRELSDRKKGRHRKRRRHNN